jgi:ABC-type lipoprotein release transport system permease subunit
MVYPLKKAGVPLKIILKYIFTNLKERKVRTAVMLLSIILSTTLLFVSFSVGASYESAQRKMSRGMAGAATISVTALTGTDGLVFERDIPALPSIKNVAGLITSPALYHENGYYESFDLFGADLKQLNQINKPRLINSGEVTDFSGNKIILPDRFTSKFNIKQGDSINLYIGEKTVTFEVAAIAAYDTVFLRSTRGTNGLLPKETLAGLLGMQNGCNEILIEPAQAAATGDLVSKLKEKLPLYAIIAGFSNTIRSIPNNLFLSS